MHAFNLFLPLPSGVPKFITAPIFDHLNSQSLYKAHTSNQVHHYSIQLSSVVLYFLSFLFYFVLHEKHVPFPSHILSYYHLQPLTFIQYQHHHLYCPILQKMVTTTLNWPEPIVRVQSISDSGIRSIPDRYVRPPSDRPGKTPLTDIHNVNEDERINIPVIDLSNLKSSDTELRNRTLQAIDDACRDWGFFQAVNHGVSHELLNKILQVWRDFFHLPADMKQMHANSPSTYEGYGSRVGVQKGAILDWSDYFFLHYFPTSIRDQSKWPSLPESCREVIAEYSNELVRLCSKLMKAFSLNLGLDENYLEEAFGGENNIGACLRTNFYPKCPQPDLTLGLSSHSDPGGMTLLLAESQVAGLQVRKDGNWVTVKPLPNAIIVNIGDQIEILSNATYKSVEHRVITNSVCDRLSLAFFYNPKSDIPIAPAKDLISDERPALYEAMTFDQYRLYIRMKGLSGKSQVESLKSPRGNCNQSNQKCM